MMRTLGLFLLFSVAIACGQQSRGTISGKVTDESGKPIVGAKVNVVSASGMMTHSIVRYFETDQTGRFVVETFAWGKYRVFGQKAADDYPDTNFAFYGNNDFPTAVVDEVHPNAIVNLVLI